MSRILTSWLGDVQPQSIGDLIRLVEAKHLLAVGHPDRLAVREAVSEALRPLGITPYVRRVVFRETR